MQRRPDSIPELQDAEFPLETIGHHEAHAYSAFWPSPFQEALIVVIDGGGNTLTHGNDRYWWRLRREQASYYIGNDAGIELLRRDFDRPWEAGFGEIYRAFTHYLGWPSSTFAGNTMALAGLGDGSLLDRSVWAIENSRITCPIPVDPVRPIDMVFKLMSELSVPLPDFRFRDGFHQFHANLAELLQASLYRSLRWQIEQLVRKTGARKVCFAGGVALNCIAIGQLVADGVVDEVFVQPAAGDTGQCLGAALAAYDRLGGFRRPADSFDPFLGRKYSSEDVRIAVDAIHSSGLRCDISENSPDSVERVARLLMAGRTVAWFSGASEFGPRALGARSILADPRNAESRKRLLVTKDRDSFQPFAPSVLDASSHKYFLDRGSHYMTVAVRVRPEAQRHIPAVIHADGTSRVQLVATSSDTDFARLLYSFGRISGLDMLLNTSLNLRGEPIAETPMDAASIFLRSDIDCLFMDGTLITRQ
jgi:carbamoyltransferase